MDDNLTDQQRADQVRSWLGENGWYLLAGLVLGLAGLFGWRQYSGFSQHQAEEASAIYADLQVAVRASRAARAEELLKQLATDYKSSPYIDLGRLLMARSAIEQGKPDAAIGELRQVVEGANSTEIGDVARLRLGRLLIQEEKYDEALKVLVPPRGSALGARYHEVRGDAYYAMGKNAEAAREYTAALTPEDVGVIDPAFVRAKLEEVGGGAAPGVVASDVAPATPAN
jgi:predicted negative regulator of RcsB-dependent stress response